MKIYLAHSRNFDYETNLYQPIRNSNVLSRYEIILPHENNTQEQRDTEYYKNLDLLIAEVSYPATGLGIELGWASCGNTPIAAIYQAGAKVSGSINAVTDEFYSYNNSEELVNLIEKIIQKHQS